MGSELTIDRLTEQKGDSMVRRSHKRTTRNRPPVQGRTTTVVAWLALVIALGGGTAYAAHKIHYLITSTTQIKPSVLTKLKRSGPTGPAGETGPSGATGSIGATGPAGPELTTLPSGKTETGAIEIDVTAPTTAVVVGSGSISFPTPLASTPTTTYVPSGSTTADCTGSASAPSAAAGYLCLYEGGHADLGGVHIVDPRNGGSEASPYGAGVWIFSGGTAATAYMDGTWAVTAP